MRASMSPEGYELTHAMMLINGFLGEVVNLETVLNEFAYNIALYGTPGPAGTVGLDLYGHHCAVNVFVVEGRIVVSPAFLGAEPDEIDPGPHAGLREVFADRITLVAGVVQRRLLRAVGVLGEEAHLALEHVEGLLGGVVRVRRDDGARGGVGGDGRTGSRSRHRRAAR
jgi:hypothetical protein